MNDDQKRRFEALMEEAARVANEELGPALDQLWGGNMTGVRGAALLMQAAAYAKTVPPPLSREAFLSFAGSVYEGLALEVVHADPTPSQPGGSA